MPRLAIAALLAAALGGSAFAQTATSTLPAADSAEQIKDGAAKAGTAVKDGAVKVGETVKEGAVKIGEALKEGAVDLWESSKAAVAAGSDTFNKRRTLRDTGRDPDAGTK
jgi:hypothetical protein